MPGFGSVGVWEVILILAVLLLVFGAKRLPEIGSALGKGIREFKGSVREIESEINRPTNRADLPRQDAPQTQNPAQGQQAQTAPPPNQQAQTQQQGETSSPAENPGQGGQTQ